MGWGAVHHKDMNQLEWYEMEWLEKVRELKYLNSTISAQQQNKVEKVDEWRRSKNIQACGCKEGMELVCLNYGS